MVKFRFQDLKIWQLAIQIADELLDVAENLEKRDCIALLNSSEEPRCLLQTTSRRVQDLHSRKNSYIS